MELHISQNYLFTFLNRFSLNIVNKEYHFKIKERNRAAVTNGNRLGFFFPVMGSATMNEGLLYVRTKINTLNLTL